jgi:hypothetical protein
MSTRGGVTKHEHARTASPKYSASCTSLATDESWSEARKATSKEVWPACSIPPTSAVIGSWRFEVVGIGLAVTARSGLQQAEGWMCIYARQRVPCGSGWASQTATTRHGCVLTKGTCKKICC